MKKVIAFVDGFNLYHSLQENKAYRKYKWLNLIKLLEFYVPPRELKEIYYFTTLAHWMPDKVQRHKIFIRALEQTGINTVYGKFKRRDRQCKICGKYYPSYEEKQTDVSIAIHLFKLAIEDRYDTALILSGDSDLLPSIKAVKTTFPSKKIVVLIPIGRAAEELQKTCDEHIKIKERIVAKSLFDNPLTMSDGTLLVKPVSWS